MAASAWITGEEAVDGKRRTGGEDILGMSEDVIDIKLRHNAQRDFAIDAAKCHVVNFVAEWRNIGTLS